MNLFKPKTPQVKDPAPMPDDDTLADAKRKRVAAETRKRGAASTILSEGGREKLG